MKIFLMIFMLVPMIFHGQTDSIAIMAQSKIDSQSENPVNSILLYLENPCKNLSYYNGFGSSHQSRGVSLKDYQFRIASSTKLFVSTIILQLAEERRLSLNDSISPYLKNIDYLNFDDIHIYQGKSLSDEITIEQLLSHRSGLADIFTDREEEFFSSLLQNPEKQYSPRSMVKLYYQFNLNKEPHFAPDNGWYYSDMNYVLLGLIIEQVEQITLAKSIRDRILNPLKMENTFFEFYETLDQKKPQVSQYVGSINFSEINTSFDWSGGGLVSTNKDLAIFIKALFNLELIDEKSLNRMIDVQITQDHQNRYGLGIYESKYNGDTYFGHYGFYGTYVGYCPKTNSIISYSISQATPNFNVYSFINEIIALAEKIPD